MNNCSNPFMNNFCCQQRRCCCHNQYCNNVEPIPGPPGPPGQAATITIGSTTTGAPGSPASVNNSGTTNNAVLNFVIPRGLPGANGEAATITIGNTTTLPAGSDATVTNSGTNTNAILNFGIPSSNGTSTDTGSFISRAAQTFTANNSIIELPITLNSEGISINNNSVISLSKSGRYMINYGIKSTTIGNTIGIYINGVNNSNTNLETIISDLNPSSSIILELNENDVITLGTVNASISAPLTLQNNTINAFVTIISLD